MRSANRRLAFERTNNLFQHLHVDQAPPRLRRALKEDFPVRSYGMRQLLIYAGLPTYPVVAWLTILMSAAALALLGMTYVHPYLIPILAPLGGVIPFSLIEGRANRRSEEFAKDYPSVLLATASSLKIGMTPYQALERSIQLLLPLSPVRKEVEKLISALRRGVRKEEAINAFGANFRLPELALFRAAFLLVLENGGRFAPTLSRLAEVSRDRQRLITSAGVSTATMRMTANFLLLIGPVLLFVMSGRYENFWEIFFNDPTANLIASLGVSIIALSFVVLRKMSAFKP